MLAHTWECLQGAFAVPPSAVAALAALLHDGRVTLQLQPPGGAHPADGPTGQAGSAEGREAAGEAHVAIALTAYALSEGPEGAPHVSSCA